MFLLFSACKEGVGGGGGDGAEFDGCPGPPEPGIEFSEGDEFRSRIGSIVLNKSNISNITNIHNPAVNSRKYPLY